LTEDAANKGYLVISPRLIDIVFLLHLSIPGVNFSSKQLQTERNQRVRHW